MTETRTCPRCGRGLPEDAPRGLCPACLLGAAMANPGDAPDVIPSSGAGAPGEGGDTAAGPRQAEGHIGTLAETVTSDAKDPDGEVFPAAGATVRYFGDYEIQAELGRGGMGVVYRAHQVSLDRPVALKLIRAGVLAGEDEMRRFQNEAEAVAALDHPGIVPVYEVGRHDGRRYFSMKLVQGGTLAERLAAYRDDPRAAAKLVAEAAEAVHHAHVRGILHRDLKPANILVDEAGHPHVTDFGLAKRVEADAELTATGAVLGTPAYMAPEQALGRRGAITTATDVHGLGTVLYALLTGRAPFGGDDVADTLTQVKERPPEPPRRHNAQVPRDLDVICLKCLEKDPGRRYASAQAVDDDLRAWLEGRPIAARPAGALERASKFVRRRPAVAAAVLVLAGFGGSLAWLWRDAVVAREEAERARDGETKARAVAERALQGQSQARVTAEKARDGEASARVEAERQREKFERFEYGRTIQVAHQEWRENNVAATLALLDRTRADLRGWEWRYVHRLCHSDLMRLRGHTGAVLSAAFSPDGAHIVTAHPGDAGQGGTAKVWDARSGAEALTLRGHTGAVRSAAFSPDGARIVTGSSDNTAMVWNARSGAEALTLRGHTGAVLSAAFSPDGARIVTGSSDNTAKVWDARSGAEALTLRGHTSHVRSAAFSPDGARIVTGSSDNTAKVWDARSGAEALTLRGHTGAVRSAAFSPDGARIVTAGYDGTTGRDGTAKVWDARSGAEALTLRGHTGAVRSAAFSPDGARIVTAGEEEDGTAKVKVWDARPSSPGKAD